MRVWKWPIELQDSQVVYMPKGAEVVSVQDQLGVICIWALCDEKAELEERVLRIYGTGHAMPDEPGLYIGTFQVHGGRLVFHLFEEII